MPFSRLRDLIAGKDLSLPMNEETLHHIISIEEEAYPEHLVAMDECEDWEDIADYCDVEEGDLHIIGGENWYGLLAFHRHQGCKLANFVDLAKRPGSEKLDWLQIGRYLISLNLDGVGMEMRESTSWKKFQRVGGTILRAFGMEMEVIDTEDREGETFYSVGLYKRSKKEEVLSAAREILGD